MCPRSRLLQKPPHSSSPPGDSNRSSMEAEREQFGEEAEVSTIKITPGVCPLVSHNPLCSGHVLDLVSPAPP